MLTQSRLTKWMSICLSLALIAGQLFMIGEPAFAFDESSAVELKEMNIIKGDGQGNLNTDKTITRLEMSVILSTIYGEDHAAQAYSGASDYGDAEKIAAWGKKYADFAKKNGWMVGDNNGNFNPEGLIGGEELAVLLLRNLGLEPGTWGSNIALFKEKTGITISEDTSITRGEIFDVLYHAVYEKESGPSSSGRKASVLEKSGKVSVKRTVSPKYIPAFVKMKVEGGDKIATDKGSWITLNFDDNKKVKFAGDTVATVDELGKTESSTSTVFVLEKGGIGTTTDGKLESGSKYEIKTPTAVLGVRGTEFYVQVEEKETEVWLAKGSVEIAYKVEGGKIKHISGAATEKTMLIDASREPVKITIPKEETEIKDEELKTETFELDGLYEEFLISPTIPELGFTKDEIEKAIEKDREKRGTVGNVDLNNNDSVEEVFPFYGEKGLAGLKDKNGNIILAPKYESISYFSDGMARVIIYKDSKFGFIDRTGKEVVPLIYNNAFNFNENLAAVWKGGKWGFIDKTGREVVSLIYDRIEDFSEGLAVVSKGDWNTGKWGYIDKTGREVIPLIYDSAHSFREGLASVEKDGKWGFIDKTGREVIPFIYDFAWWFRNGLCEVKKDEKTIYIDRTGKEVIPLIYDSVEIGLGDMSRVKKNGKTGFIDKTGKEVIPLIYDYASSFTEDLSLVRKDGKYGFIDKAGREVIPLIYDDAEFFREGLASVAKDGKWGFIDKTGQEVIPFIYHDVDDFREGMAEVISGDYTDRKSGFIDKTGKVLVPLIYDDAEFFSKGLVSVKKDEKWGFVDQTGQIVIPLIYDDVYIPWNREIARVEKDGKHGFVDSKGKEIVTPIYDNSGFDVMSGLVWVEKNGKFGFIDMTGREVIPLVYDDIDRSGRGALYGAFVQKDGKWFGIDKLGIYLSIIL